MPEAKRPDPKRRTPASRPAKSGKSGKAGDSARGRPRTNAPARRESRNADARTTPQPQEQTTTESIRKSIAEAAEQQSEQRLGSTARRAAILAAVICVLTLTIAGPVRTYFSQRTEMRQLAASEDKLRGEIANLEEQKAKLADPGYIAAQARERLGFVKPGDVPFQVQLPPGAIAPTEPGTAAEVAKRAGQPWYTSLWHTIADDPHNIPSAVPAAPPDAPPPDARPPGG